MDIKLLIARAIHLPFAKQICDLIETSAHQRGTGIAVREVRYIEEKIRYGNAIIALAEKQLAGFCYIETWDQKNYVANSGLIVHPDYRKQGLAKKIKALAFQLARDKYPTAKIFGITTNGTVMKINAALGYIPVPFAELTQDETFWNGCQSCPNYDILQRNKRKMCLCTGMLAPSKLDTVLNTENIKKESSNI